MLADLGRRTRRAKRLIAAYRRSPTEENKAALRRQCEKNYEKILGRKKAKLEELKREAKHQSKVDEMQDIVDEMITNREHRIDQTMARFTDPRFRGGSVSPHTPRLQDSQQRKQFLYRMKCMGCQGS